MLKFIHKECVVKLKENIRRYYNGLLVISATLMPH